MKIRDMLSRRGNLRQYGGRCAFPAFNPCTRTLQHLVQSCGTVRYLEDCKLSFIVGPSGE
jgi:hypothetical protein